MNGTRFCFYLELDKIQPETLNENLDSGNPGLGGTQYLFLLTVHNLNKKYGSDYAVLLTNTDVSSTSNHLIHFINVSDASHAVEYCETNHIDNLVFNVNLAGRVNRSLFDTSVNIILWAHNTVNGKCHRIAATTKSIKWIVCVSESQYENMADTPCFNKCTFINNIIPKEFYDKAHLTDYSENKVAYVGSIMPQKGLHNLIEIWKIVESKSPQTQLYIFGSSNIWNNAVSIDNNIFSDQYYGKVLRKRLNRLAHPENIHFMGAKGWRFLRDYISTFRLGVVNPSYYMRDETFCLSAIEMETMGLPVISRKRHDGLNTSILNEKTGFLGKTNEEIADKILQVVSDVTLAKELGGNARKHSSSFIAEDVVSRWYELDKGTIDHGVSVRVKWIPNDSKMLIHDFFLKILFLLESHKISYLVFRPFRRK